MPRYNNGYEPLVRVNADVHPCVKDRLADEAVRFDMSPSKYTRAVLHQWFLENRGLDYAAIAERETFNEALNGDLAASTS